ncbi:hypothetical protein BQ8420_18460 [Nocardiopsis sp. JB363]|nr:hypothetical protein BQ8420_18460 [Nocardiopsis sp. JB363]
MIGTDEHNGDGTDNDDPYVDTRAPWKSPHPRSPPTDDDRTVMVSPVLFYHQVHPVKAEAMKIPYIAATYMPANIAVPSPRRGAPLIPEHATQITSFVG